MVLAGFFSNICESMWHIKDWEIVTTKVCFVGSERDSTIGRAPGVAKLNFKYSTKFHDVVLWDSSESVGDTKFQVILIGGTS